MKVLLSIKPEYVERIFSGQKKFEYRRTIFRDPNVTSVVVYASSPVRLVVGEFEVNHVLQHSIKRLWKTTKEFAGISEENFFQYFWGKETGYAISIGRTRHYRRPLLLAKEFGIAPPQSFAYLDD